MERGAVIPKGLYEARAISRGFDWPLLVSALLLVGAGLVTINSFVGENILFEKQFSWLLIALSVFFLASLVDVRFLRRTGIVTLLYFASLGLLVAVLLLGSVTKGATSWFSLGPFAFQPSNLAALVLVIVLAKYFSRRHVEIAHFRHILISGLYALLPCLLIFIQPDFGSAIIIFLIWLGMVLVSGISKKHLAGVFLLGLTAFALLWGYGFAPYQKERILSFLHPLADLQGAGYNAYQSTIAVGSGEFLGKGIGFGTQSRLQFLPEYETDFIFAAFAEEWGLLGVLLLFAIFGFLIYRILANAVVGATNFETLFSLGLAIFFMSHFAIHVGINIGLLPVTGTTVPFLSYGGSHLVIEFLGLGIVNAMRRYARPVHRADADNEFLGTAQRLV